MDQEYIAQTALDQMVGTDQGQLLKALIPYFPPRAWLKKKQGNVRMLLKYA